jgi:thiol:disulfide interchange protein DsbD
MVWVKKVFGVVMVGAALFYVGLVLFPKQTVYVVPVTLLIGGMYLGFLESSGKNNPEATGLRRIQLIFGAASILLSVVSLQALQKPAIKWRPYTPEKLAEAIAAKKPVMMDFYADWCIPCLELDRLTFTDETMIEATDDFVKLKVDLTHFNSADSETLRRSFNVSGVPTIVFLGPDGYETPDTRVVGYLKPEEFIKRMQPVLSLAEVRLSETESNP